jgi:hypothetical protein
MQKEINLIEIPETTLSGEQTSVKTSTEKSDLGNTCYGSPIFFRSTGLIYGLYLPSDDDKTKGVLMTDVGLFPAAINENIRRFFKKHSKKKTLKRKHHFICWVRGIPDPPHYQLTLTSRTGKNNLPEIFPVNNSFICQGIVTERSRERVILKVQMNARSSRTREDIEQSINYLEIKDCPGKVRTSQFWQFRSTFREGFLHCESGELLANAKVTKQFIKDTTAT